MVKIFQNTREEIAVMRTEPCEERENLPFPEYHYQVLFQTFYINYLYNKQIQIQLGDVNMKT